MQGAGKMLLVIPMKDPTEAKSRLGGLLAPKERARLAIALFLNVVECVKRARACLPHRQIDIAVVSNSPTIRAYSDRLDLEWIDEGEVSSLSDAVECAATVATVEGYAALCVLPGDLADPAVEDLVRLMECREGEADVVLCPSHDMGTNALILPLPSSFGFHYGERSFHRHYRAATDAGLMTMVMPLDSLRRDVDTIYDLDDLERRRPEVVFWGEGR